ncbi:MAG: 50S ribosomal protein L18 [Gammaproteobacteria bacterium]|nr:50S ribosomal protein L18 [Gammaproteobacteria bacterium]
MSVKKTARLRRARKTRARIREQGVNRLCVFRSPRHMYAQIIAPGGAAVIACASTVEKDQRAGATGNVEAAGKVGQLIAERALAAGIDTVAFDRSGYAYHGRVKALADAAREAGLKF